jgi:hypothetical protein
VSADHPTCFSFLETSCGFSRRPVHQTPLALCDVLTTGPAEKAVYWLNGNASSPFQAEPAQIIVIELQLSNITVSQRVPDKVADKLLFSATPGLTEKGQCLL